jgi:hypothetical protein
VQVGNLSAQEAEARGSGSPWAAKRDPVSTKQNKDNQKECGWSLFQGPGRQAGSPGNEECAVLGPSLWYLAFLSNRIFSVTPRWFKHI